MGLVTLEATAMQAGLLFESNLGARPWVHLEQVVVDLGPGTWMAGAIFDAWSAVARRHPALRSQFYSDVQGALAIVVHPEAQFGRAETEAAGDSQLAVWLEADRVRGADPTLFPNWRVTCMDRGSDGMRMVWTIHHALVDGAGMELALAEVLDHLHGRQMPGEGAAGGSFAQALAGCDAAAAQRHFASTLEAPGTPAGFLTAAPATPARVARRAVVLDSALSESLRHAARRSGGTVLSIVQAVWALVLTRWSGAPDAVLGLVESRRRLVPGFETHVGCLIGTLPFRVQLDPGMTLGALVADVRQRTLAQRPHAHAALGAIRRWIGAPGGQPLFDTLVMVARGTLDGRLRAQGKLGAGQSVRLFEEGAAACTLAVYDDPQMLVELEFDPARLAQPDRVLGHVLALLRAFAEGDPATPLGALRMLDPQDEAELAALAEPDRPVQGADPCLATRFESVARAHRDEIAVEDAETGAGMTFGALDAAANALAWRLVEGGVGPGDLVALHLARGLAVPVAMLAVLKAGAAFLPLDPEQPHALLADLIENAGARALIAPATSPLGAAVALHLPPDGAARGDAPPRGAGDAARLAYVIHTSGSTGRPKGVRGLAGALSAHADAAIDRYALTSQDRVLQFAGLAFDVALEEILPTLLAGARLVLRSEDAAGSVPGFLDLVTRRRISVLNLPASFWHVLVEDMARRALPVPPDLRLVVTGSERINPGALAQWQRMAPGLGWINGYGPTEATITATSFALPPQSAPVDAAQDVPIGRPLGHARARLRAVDGSLTPRGGVGTLWLGGAAVAGGYLGLSDESAERFVPDPWLPGARLYNSGDLARWGADGELRFLGRQDRQIKLRGHRIDLHQIESAMVALPGVSRAHVALLTEAAQARLVAWYVAEAPLGDTATLRAALAQRLPRYMLPELVAVDALPTGPNGKIDTRALSAALPRTLPPAAPAQGDALADQIADCMAEVLATQSVPLDASFHDLGGDSLLALRLVSLIETKTGQPCRVSDLHQHPSALALSQLLRGGSARPRFILPIQPGGARPVFFGVHVLGPGGALFRPLAEALGPDFPVMGLSIGVPRSLDEIDVEQVARLYFEDIQRHYPTGPVALGAVSMAAYFAFELAQLLRAAGREVRLLALLDARGPDGRPAVEGLAKLRAHLGQLRRNGLRHLANVLENRREKRREAAEARASDETEINGYNLVAANVRAVEDYRPQPYSGRLTLFRADRCFWDSPAALESGLGWASVARGGFDLYDVPGTHLSILAPENVGVMAEHLRRLLGQDGA